MAAAGDPGAEGQPPPGRRPRPRPERLRHLSPGLSGPGPDVVIPRDTGTVLTDPSRGAIFSATGRALGHLPGRQVRASVPLASPKGTDTWPRQGPVWGHAGRFCHQTHPPAPQPFSQECASEICSFSLVFPILPPFSHLLPQASHCPEPSFSIAWASEQTAPCGVAWDRDLGGRRAGREDEDSESSAPRLPGERTRNHSHSGQKCLKVPIPWQEVV